MANNEHDFGWHGSAEIIMGRCSKEKTQTLVWYGLFTMTVLLCMIHSVLASSCLRNPLQKLANTPYSPSVIFGHFQNWKILWKEKTFGDMPYLVQHVTTLHK